MSRALVFRVGGRGFDPQPSQTKYLKRFDISLPYPVTRITEQRNEEYQWFVVLSLSNICGPMRTSTDLRQYALTATL